jgi:hypothetical protein
MALLRSVLLLPPADRPKGTMAAHMSGKRQEMGNQVESAISAGSIIHRQSCEAMKSSSMRTLHSDQRSTTPILPARSGL